MNKDRTDMLWGNRVSVEYITNIALRIVQERIDRDHQLKNEILCEEIKRLGYVGAVKKYGVSNNVIRKWKRHHESQFEN